MKTKKQTMRGQITRLRIFGLVKEWVQKYHEWPTSDTIMQLTGMSQATIRRHLRSLQNATGLNAFHDEDDGDIPEAVDIYLHKHLPA